jgi:hypothetical protein
MVGALTGIVAAVSRSATHTISKPNQQSIRLLAGLGVEGDVHMGEKVNTAQGSRVTRISRTCVRCT